MTAPWQRETRTTRGRAELPALVAPFGVAFFLLGAALARGEAGPAYAAVLFAVFGAFVVWRKLGKRDGR